MSRLQFRIIVNERFTFNEAIIIGDEKLMVRIFNNLILNAYQSIPEGKEPKIEIELKGFEDKIRVSISDNGKGISEQIGDKVFVPNFTTKSSGSGIGLAVAKRGVELMQGELWFESSINEGTVFFLEFPLAP